MAESREMVASTDSKPIPSQRFTQLVMREYQSAAEHEFTEREMTIIRNYFVCIDQTLRKADADRIRKNENNRDHSFDNNTPITWANINLQQLARDLAHYAHMGLDMMESNTLFPIPYKDNKSDTYTITLMLGYNGLRYQAEKYALVPFKNVTVEVVYSNDNFRVIKKSARNPVEAYEFDITNPFDRGQPIGVFGYIEYDDPTKNKLVIFNKADIEKRKPAYASAEFWGGEKKVKEKGQYVQKQLDGWVPEMWEKTMKRAIYSAKYIPRDPAKMDASYQYIAQREQQYANIAVEAEVAENANAEPISLPKQPQQAPQAAPVQQEAATPTQYVTAADYDNDEVPF